ncbi:hypothetical protein Q3G72_003965 [Acer saccharum]|nr:hypothetical protein Q3G72_003965 [Acer saccharum]
MACFGFLVITELVETSETNVVNPIPKIEDLIQFVLGIMISFVIDTFATEPSFTYLEVRLLIMIAVGVELRTIFLLFRGLQRAAMVWWLRLLVGAAAVRLKGVDYVDVAEAKAIFEGFSWAVASGN